jgi:hypothetical protein
VSQSFESPQLEPTGGPEIARIGGRRSAVVGTLAVVGVLVAVVWVGVSGRSAPAVPPTVPAVAAQPTAVSTSPEPSEQAGPAFGEPDDPVAVSRSEVFGVYAQFGTSQYITILNEPEPGHLVGRLEMRLPIPADEGIFVFELLASRAMTGGPRYIGDWPINVEKVTADAPDVAVLSVSPPAQRTRLGAPTPVVRGFQLTVSASRDATIGELVIDVRIAAGRQIVGDDGIFGWPTLANIQPRVDRPVVVAYDRTRGRYNYCRWDLTPLSAPPRPGTDEAAC